MPRLLQLLLLRLDQLRCVSVQERLFRLILDHVLRACSAHTSRRRNGSRHTAKLSATSVPWGAMGTRGDRTWHQAERATDPASSSPRRCGMRPPLGALRIPCAAEEKGGTALYPHRVLPRLQHAVPCSKLCFCRDPLSGEQHLHGHAVPSAVLSTGSAPGHSIPLQLTACCCCCFKGHTSIRLFH